MAQCCACAEVTENIIFFQWDQYLGTVPHGRSSILFSTNSTGGVWLDICADSTILPSTLIINAVYVCMCKQHGTAAHEYVQRDCHVGRTLPCVSCLWQRDSFSRALLSQQPRTSSCDTPNMSSGSVCVLKHHLLLQSHDSTL